MALILSIDTATEFASIALTKEERLIGLNKNHEIKDHASWIHNAIQRLMAESGHSLSQLNAIAVTAGPGSYTGLRVGMATAKGLCYVLNLPLITENTLKVMTQSAIEMLSARETAPNEQLLLIPMIDARRMEVFTAAYSLNLEEVMPPVAIVLDASSYNSLNGRPLICFGSGSKKFQSILQNHRFTFNELTHDAGSLAKLVFKKYQAGEFADLAYTEPFYLKEFFSPAKK